jgi:hypothetical protein
LKRTVQTERAASSASRSSLLWVREGRGFVLLLVERWVVAWGSGRAVSLARYGRASGIVTGISWQSSAMIPTTMGAEKDGQPFDKERMRVPNMRSQGIEQASSWPKTGDEGRDSHSTLHRGARDCLGRPPWQRSCGFAR